MCFGVIIEIILNCKDFQNVPFISPRGGLINCNPVLSPCQLCYLLRKKPEDRLLEECIVAEGVEDLETVKRNLRAWSKIH